jgi:hypothetical protein
MLKSEGLIGAARNLSATSLPLRSVRISSTVSSLNKDDY